MRIIFSATLRLKYKRFWKLVTKEIRGIFNVRLLLNEDWDTPFLFHNLSSISNQQANWVWRKIYCQFHFYWITLYRVQFILSSSFFQVLCSFYILPRTGKFHVRPTSRKRKHLEACHSKFFYRDWLSQLRKILYSLGNSSCSTKLLRNFQRQRN